MTNAIDTATAALNAANAAATEAQNDLGRFAVKAWQVETDPTKTDEQKSESWDLLSEALESFNTAVLTEKAAAHRLRTMEVS